MTDTSKEAVERLAAEHMDWADFTDIPAAERLHTQTAERLRALLAERDAARASFQKAFDYARTANTRIKALEAERDALQAQVTELQRLYNEACDEILEYGPTQETKK